MSVDYDRIAEAVSPDQLARVLRAERKGTGWHCPSPEHEDGDPSFSVFRDGARTAAKCHGCGLGGSPVSVASQVWGVSLPDAAERIVSELGIHVGTNGNGGRHEIVAEYDYTDEDGVVLFQVVRLGPRKSFRQRRPDGKGGWSWSLGDVRRVLYRLPQLFEGVALGKTVHIVEGEKDVEAIEAAGGVATCNPGGAGKWRAEYSEALQGARVIIVADTDEAGREHAEQVATSLEGVASSVEIVEAAAGKDAADHLAAGHRLDDFLREEAKLPSPVSITELLAFEEPEEAFHVEELVEQDANVLIVAAPKSHKTNLMLHVAVAGCAGRSVLGAFRVPEPIKVGLVLMEDRPHRIKRRIKRIAASEGVDPESLEGRLFIWFRPSLRLNEMDVIGELGDYVERLDLDVLVIDSYAYVSVGDSNSADEVTPQLIALSSLRDRRRGLSVALIVHAGKHQENRGERVTDIIRGSGAFGAWYDTGVLLTRKDEHAPVTMRVEHRDLPAPEPFAFTVEDEHAGPPPSGFLRLRRSGKTAEQLLREQNGAKLAPALKERLASRPDGVSRRELRELIDAPRRDVEAAFEVLRDRGEAVFTPSPGKGRAARYSLTVPGVP